MVDTAKIQASSRSATRLGAVQALYQMDIAGADLADVLAEFGSVRLGEEFENGECGDADFDFLKALVRGVLEQQREIDPLINERLASGWKLSRLDTTLRAILRAGAYELKNRRDVPPRASISEYIDVAKAFFDGDEPKVVNAVLDKLAHEFEREGI